MDVKMYSQRLQKYDDEVDALKTLREELLKKGRSISAEEFDKSVDLTARISNVLRERARFEESSNVEADRDAEAHENEAFPLLEPVSHGPIIIRGVRDPMNP